MKAHLAAQQSFPTIGDFTIVRRGFAGAPLRWPPRRASVFRYHHCNGQQSASGMSTTSSWTSRSYWPTKGSAALFDYAAGSNRRAAIVLVVVSLITFLPGFFQIPPVDRDEAYFAGYQADDRNRRLCRYSLSGRCALPQTRRHLLAASGGREHSLCARSADCAHDYMALSLAVADCCDWRCARHLLVCARFCRSARCAPCGLDADVVGNSWRRGPPRQD